jgi:hypothetical protein
MGGFNPCQLAPSHQNHAPIVTWSVLEPLAPDSSPPVPSLPVNIFGVKILLELVWIPNQNQVALPPLHVGNAPKNQEFLGFQ